MEGPQCRESSLWRLAISSTLLALLATVARAANVTITHLRLDTTHDSPYSPWEPSVYFQCEGEMKHFLQGVVQANVTYNFTGQEAFQPLVELASSQCKTCGLYEADTWKADDTFDKFQLCADDFRSGKEGRVARWVAGEFKVALLCPECLDRHDHTPVEALLQGDSFYPLLPFLIFLAAAATITCAAAILSCCIERSIWPFNHTKGQQHTALEKEQLAEATAFIGSSDEEEEEGWEDGDGRRDGEGRERGRGAEGIEMGDVGRREGGGEGSGLVNGGGGDVESGEGGVGGSGRKAQGDCMHGRPYSVPLEERVDV
ncbi:hypothetical protein CLOM_g2692 [Closterium sp. NIES-68]|nr:hypothetical protein CLOM_g2692 [Closterium sp. NIES-68]